MRLPGIRRLISGLAVVALLLAGFAAATVVAEPPCAMAMSAGQPCDNESGSAPADSKQGTVGLACFAKCPAPLVDRTGILAAPPFSRLERVVLYRSNALTGIGVAPPLEPPRT